MAAPICYHLALCSVLFVCASDIVLCAENEPMENVGMAMGLSVVSASKPPRPTTIGSSVVSESKPRPLFDDDTDECPDPDLVAAFHAKYSATTAYNSTSKFMETMMGVQIFNRSSIATCPFDEYELIKLQAKAGKQKTVCVPIARGINDTLQVRLVNSSSLLQTLGHKNNSKTHCSMVLFYAPWCMFCAQMAPHYNALARAFPQIDILAIDAVHFSSLNTRYGTVAVPNLLLFYNDSKAVAKFNHTERNYENLVSFVSNVTGFKPDPTVHVTSQDFDGPLSSKPSEDRDWLLWLAWVFVTIFCSTVFIKSVLGQALYTRIINSWKDTGNAHN